ncbi:MAG: DUF5677 domain-containing protein [Dehalococcoidales bacterium]
MPTKQFESLLYRELRKVEAKEVIEIASPLLQEEVNYATNAFHRCQESAVSAAADEPLPVFASYYHVIGMTDGIEVLISQSCAVPAIPLLRSSFEALLTIEYILEGDYQRRAFAWLVCYVYNRLSQYEMLDPSHQKGKEFLVTFAADSVSKYMKLPSLPSLSQVIHNLKSLLNNPNYQLADYEYQRIKSIRKRKPNWYSLFGGPGNLRDLAKHLNWGAQYDILYRAWSSITHADDLSQFLTQTKRGYPAFYPLRNNEELKLFSVIASSFILHATKKMLGKFRAGEMASFGRWYVREARDRHLALTN